MIPMKIFIAISISNMQIFFSTSPYYFLIEIFQPVSPTTKATDTNSNIIYLKKEASGHKTSPRLCRASKKPAKQLEKALTIK